jgi:hypothetical protein
MRPQYRAARNRQTSRGGYRRTSGTKGHTEEQHIHDDYDEYIERLEVEE